MRVRLRGSRWSQLLAPAAIPDAAETTLRSELFEVIVVERDESKQRTSIRIASRGKSVLTFSATGAVDGPMSRVRILGGPRYVSVVKKQGSIAGVRAALLGLFDAKPRELAVERREDLTLLRTTDGRALRVADVEEAYMVEYSVITAAESPAGVALHSAIDSADPAGIRKAIRQGASLEFLPDMMRKPLDAALTKRKGRWLACVKELFDAGAALDAGPYRDPAIIVGVDVSGAKEESTIELVDFLLTRGSTVGTTGTTQMHLGWTPLHVAANNGMLGVVMHLVALGADVHAKIPSGLKASALPRPFHTFLGVEHQAVRDFLLMAERGGLGAPLPSARVVARNADRWRDGVKGAIGEWAKSAGSPLAAFFGTGERERVGKTKRRSR